MSLALAVDLGGTKLEVGLVDETGAVRPGSRFRQPTGPGITPDKLHGSLVQLVRSALEGETDVVGAGMGSAGPVDPRDGTIAPVNMPNLRGMVLQDALADAVARAGFRDLPVRVGHDGGCIALAESWVGAARDARASLSIVVSTGIGGGFVVDGALLAGASGNAGHLGQTLVDGDVTLEEIASGPASVAWAQTQGWAGTTGEELGAAAAAGDRVARAAAERSARAVGRALANAATLVDLDVIAVGGGFSHVSDDYTDLVQTALREAAVLPYAAAARVVRSGLRGDGPLVGAAALVLRR